MTYLAAQLPLDNREITEKPGKIYLLPFIMLFMSSMVVYKIGTTSRSATALAYEQDPSRMIFLGITYLLALLLFVNRLGKGIQFFLNNKIYLSLLSYVLFSAYWSGFPAKVFINWGHYAGLSLVLFSAAFYFSGRPERFFWVAALTLGIVIAASIPISIYLPKIGIDLNSGRWQGITGNPNSLGVLCIISIWANASCLYLSNNRLIRCASAIMALISAIALWKTGSMTSKAVTFFILTSVSFLISIGKGSPTVKIMKIVAAIWLAFFLIGVFILLYPEIFTTEGAFSSIGRNATITGRNEVWAQGWKLSQIKPIFGWSFDSCMSAFRYINLHSTEFKFGQIHFGQFHSGYFDLLVRGGGIGLTLFFFILVRMFLMIKRGMKSNYRLVTIYAVMILAILLHNVTEASIMRETDMFWLIFVYIYFSLEYLFSKKRYTSAGDP